MITLFASKWAPYFHKWYIFLSFCTLKAYDALLNSYNNKYHVKCKTFMCTTHTHNNRSFSRSSQRKTCLYILGYICKRKTRHMIYNAVLGKLSQINASYTYNWDNTLHSLQKGDSIFKLVMINGWHLHLNYAIKVM